MNQSIKRISLLIIFAIFAISACRPNEPKSDSTEMDNRVATSVALTLTAYQANQPTSTSTPLPTATEPATPTPTVIIPTVVIPTTKPEYACDIINQSPYDDQKFHMDEDFDIKWTIVNTGTQRWEAGTYLEYQTGPKMTSVMKVELPTLKPGGQYDVILDAKAPSERDRQIMVWQVTGPGTIKNSKYWMCYPYVRIIVGK